MATLLPVGAGTNDSGEARFAVRARQAFAAAQKHYDANPNDTDAAWKFARAVFDRAEFATNDTERATFAVQGIAACRTTLERNPDSAPAHYYLGMNLGQLARTKTLGALRLVDEMEREFKAAHALDQRFDFAGPSRNLGLLYLEAPAIGSIGSRSRAREHLQRAAVLAPHYPENRLNLAEAYLKWRDKKSFQREMEAIETLWPKAQERFSGPEWESGWADWNARREQLRFKAGEQFRALTSPRAVN